VSQEHIIIDTGARCVHGSTLLHTATHYADVRVIKKLLRLRVNVDLEDYQGSTPLHRAKDPEVLKLLLDSNAHVNAVDREGNTCLHVRCYGDRKASYLEAISMLMQYDADVTMRNKSDLMPVHCAAMQGRCDVIEMILAEHGDLIRSEISKESSEQPPSLPYLSFASNHVNSAKWLIEQGFQFKHEECDQLMFRMLTGQLDTDDKFAAVEFLLKSEASVNMVYEGGDSILHLAARMSENLEITRVLIAHQANVDEVNDSGSTPLFDAVRTSNFHLTKLLIEKGANMRRINNEGLTCFDFIHDFSEWMDTSLLPGDVIERLKAYEMKHTRNLVRVIAKRIEAADQRALKAPQIEKTTTSSKKGRFNLNGKRSPSKFKENLSLRKLSATMNHSKNHTEFIF